jgi:hypothetical protein
MLFLVRTKRGAVLMTSGRARRRSHHLKASTTQRDKRNGGEEGKRGQLSCTVVIDLMEGVPLK